MKTDVTAKRLTTLALAVLLTGAATGALFGRPSIPEGEKQITKRASHIATELLDWLPEEQKPSDLIYDGISGMLQVLDPHSNFLDPRTYQKMRERQEGSFFGVGIIISMRAGKITVIAPMAGTPAAAKGLRAGDVIAGVDGAVTEDITLDEVVDHVRGPEGTPVLLTIRRPGIQESFDVEILRARIPTNSVTYAFMVRPDVGYIRLGEFTNTSVREVREAVVNLQQEGMNSLIFDLRNNPGGPLDAAVGVSDVFLRKDQLVVTTRGRTEDSVSTLDAPGIGPRFEGPLVVLVNEGSASASEIVAGAVQDHDRGLVLGETTWGKGLVQTVFGVRDGGLALTTARYYTPSGRCIQRNYDSFIDYITHRNGNGDSDEMEREIYETDAGRTVLGGGGITPDVTVSNRELSESVVRLYGSSAYFRFAVELLKDIAPEQQTSFAGDLSVEDAVLERFYGWVTTEEILDEEGITAVRENEQATEAVARAIEIEVLNAAIDLKAGFRHAIEMDDQYRAALEHLVDAADLWEAWQAEV